LLNVLVEIGNKIRIQKLPRESQFGKESEPLTSNGVQQDTPQHKGLHFPFSVSRARMEGAVQHSEM
jgi:hypothetical protein